MKSAPGLIVLIVVSKVLVFIQGLSSLDPKSDLNQCKRVSDGLKPKLVNFLLNNVMVIIMLIHLGRKGAYLIWGRCRSFTLILTVLLLYCRPI